MSIYEKIESSLAKIEETIDLSKKKHRDHLKTQRPFFEPVQEGSYQDKNFIHYLKKGDFSLETKALTSSGETGGMFMPPKIKELIFDQLEGLSPIRRFARVSTITGEGLEVLTEKKKADAGWIGEEEQAAETETPELHCIRIDTHQIYAKPKITQKLLDDSAIDLEGWLMSKVAEKISTLENTAFLHGDGDHKPKGILSYPRVPVGHKEWGKFETIKTGSKGELKTCEPLLQAVSALKGRFMGKAVWMMSHTAMAEIQKLKERGRFLWQAGLSEKAPATLLGYPVVICDEMPALISGKNSTPIIFGDFSKAYQIVDRQGIHILRDPYTAKPYVEFYVTKRVGGDVINFDALKIIDCDVEDEG